MVNGIGKAEVERKGERKGKREMMVNLSYNHTLRRDGDNAANSKNSGDDLHDYCEQLYTVE